MPKDRSCLFLLYYQDIYILLKIDIKLVIYKKVILNIGEVVNIKTYLNALLTKFLMYAPLIGIGMPLFSTVTVKGAVITAFFAALAAFLTADLVVYPRYGNIPAVLTDVVITIAVLVVMSLRAGSISSWFGMLAF